MASGLCEESRAVKDRSSFTIAGSKNDPFYAGEAQGRRAHRTGFKGDVQVKFRQALYASHICDFPYHEDFGVGCRIGERYGPVSGPRENISGYRVYKNGTDGHLIGICGFSGLFHRRVHTGMVKFVKKFAHGPE